MLEVQNCLRQAVRYQPLELVQNIDTLVSNETSAIIKEQLKIAEEEIAVLRTIPETFRLHPKFPKILPDRQFSKFPSGTKIQTLKFSDNLKAMIDLVQLSLLRNSDLFKNH